MNFFNSLYTLQDIAIHHNLNSKDLRAITKYSNNKDLQSITKKCPFFRKFVKYCKSYETEDGNVYAIPAYIYDLYTDTGLLIDIDLFDRKQDKSKLNYWEYNPFINLELDLTTGWSFAKSVYKNKDSKIKDEDIWKMFLAGCARMDYYQNEEVDIEQRIKYAIVEYMLKRPQFFTTDDFIDNPILHKKYEK